MKIKIKRHLSLVILALMIGVASSASALAAAVSSDFVLDFDTISTGSEQYSSNNFELQSGLTAIETNSNSTSFQITTINNIPLCGDGTAQTTETCDGNDFKGQSCSTFGFNSGTLVCSSDCSTLSILGCSFVGGGGGGGGGGTGLLLTQEEPEPEPQEPELEPEPEPEIPSDGTGGPEEPPPQPKAEPLPYIPPKIGKYNYHFEEYKKRETISTVDITPLFVDKMDHEKNYIITIRNEGGDVLIQKELTTDIEGNFIYETEIDLEIGNYLIDVRDPEDGEFEEYILEILDKRYPEIDIENFGVIENPKVNFTEIIDLGDIEKIEGQTITGYTVPSSTIYTYFQAEKIHIIERKANNEGYFEIAIPDELELGDHTVYIVQTYPDLVVSRDIIYKFKLIEAKDLEREKADLSKKLDQCKTFFQRICLCGDSLIINKCLPLAAFILLILITFLTYRKRK